MRSLKLGVVLLAIGLLTVPILATAQESASLLVGNGFGTPSGSDTVEVRLGFDTETEISAINFDLGYDPSRVRVAGVSLGSAAPSEMNLSTSSPSAGMLRLLIFNLSSPAATFGSGAILEIEFAIVSSAPAGKFQLELSSAEMADPSGFHVTHSTRNGSFTIGLLPRSSTPTSTPGRRAPTATAIGPTPTENSARDTRTPTPSKIALTPTDRPVRSTRTPIPTGIIPAPTQGTIVPIATSTPRIRPPTATEADPTSTARPVRGSPTRTSTPAPPPPPQHPPGD